MNKLVIPPSPNWYSSSILACAPDNTIIYGSRNEIIVVYPGPSEEPADIKILGGLHTSRVLSVAVNKNWGNPNKWAVSVGEDNLVQLLDVATCTAKISHVGHKTHADKVVGAEFAGEDRVISISERGFIIIWKLSTSSLSSISVIKDANVKVSTISICPHASWLIAIGTKKGAILIADLKKSGRVMFRIKAHEEEIISLSWCPTAQNVFPEKIMHKKKNKPMQIEESAKFNSEATLPDLVPQEESLPLNNPCEPQSLPTKNEEGAQESADGILLESKHKASDGDIILVDRSDSSTETLTDDKIESKPFNCNDKTGKDQSGAPEKSENNEKSMQNTVQNAIEPVDIIEIYESDEPGDIIVILESDEGSSEVEESNTENDVQTENKQEQGVTIDKCESDEKNTEEGEIKTENVVQNGNKEGGSINRSESDDKSIEKEERNTEDDVQSGNKQKQGGTITKCESDEKNTEEEEIKTEIVVPNNQGGVVDKSSTEEAETKSENINGVLKQTKRQEFLLASSGRGARTIKIWRAGTDSLLETELVFPKAYSPRSKGDRSWITICWITPRSLLSSGNKAQLLHWRFRKLGKNKPREYQPRLIHNDHSKQMFCIAAPVRKHESADDEDWRDKNLLNAWTLGSDRYVLNTSLGHDHKSLSIYATIGGTITCLAPSSIDPTRIACGMGDGNARLIDLSRPHLQTLSMSPLYDKGQIKVTSFAWHPHKEACLGYGTHEGHVGLIDTTSTSKNITEFVPSGHQPLYSLQWGPVIGDLDNLSLYVISNGKLVTYDVKKPLNAPTQIDISNGAGLTSFAWKHDYSLLAVATKNYELLLYNNDLKLLSTFLLQNKTVRCMEWHPPGTSEENWLALSTTQIIVVDCSLSNLETDNKYEECAVAIFSQHQGYVHSVTWSPHQTELLASAGDYGLALVWNVKTKTLLHACVSHHDTFYGVLWSPLDPDYLITGGRGCTLKIWKLSEISSEYKIEKPQQKQALSLETSKDGDEIPTVKPESKPRRSLKFLLNGIAQVHNLNLHIDMLEDCIKLFNSKYSENYEDVHKHTKKLKNEEPSVFNILDLFEEKEGIDKILKLERENHANRTTPLCIESISLWQGDIGETIKNAAMCGSLNQWLVSIAPMVSFNLWQEACEAYAKQLLNEAYNRPIEAAYYFLACHKVEDAVEALCFGSYYREALILAKSRLSSDDPLINSIIKRWATYSTSIGKYEISAQCYIVLNMLEEATKVLFRRMDVPILEFCVRLARKTGNEELIKATMFRLNAFRANGEQADKTVSPLKSRLELELENNESPAVPLGNLVIINELSDNNSFEPKEEIPSKTEHADTEENVECENKKVFENGNVLEPEVNKEFQENETAEASANAEITA